MTNSSILDAGDEIRTACGMISRGIERLGDALAQIVEGNANSIRHSEDTDSLVMSPIAESDSDQHGKRGKRGAAKTPKDPNAPKRPLSSFLLFSMEHRPKVIKEHPDMPYVDVTRLLGQMWEKADKTPYENSFKQNMATFKLQMEQYKATGGFTSSESTSTPVVVNQKNVTESSTAPAITVTAAPANLGHEGDLGVSPITTDSNTSPKKKKSKKPTTTQSSQEVSTADASSASVSAASAEQAVKKSKKHKQSDSQPILNQGANFFM